MNKNFQLFATSAVCLGRPRKGWRGGGRALSPGLPVCVTSSPTDPGCGCLSLCSDVLFSLCSRFSAVPVTLKHISEMQMVFWMLFERSPNQKQHLCCPSWALVGFF